MRVQHGDRFIWLIVILTSFNSVATSQVDTVIICNPGDPITLSALPDMVGYRWNNARSLDNPTIRSPEARPVENTLYVVEMLQSQTSVNLIQNPSFELGNEGFESDYGYAVGINRQGVYGVNESAANLNATYFEDCPDHTSGDGKMMVIDGSPIPNEFVWCQQIDVIPNTQYSFATWLTSVNPNNPAELQFSINGEQLGDIFKSTSNLCQWRQFYELWDSGDATVAEICIINQNTNPQGNDFALDDFGFFELEEVIYDSTYVVVEALTAAQEKRIYWPNVFSPNGDRVNDYFAPAMEKGIILLRTMSIYDRWGTKVFTVDNCFAEDGNSCGWDGRINDQRASPGTYSYVAKVYYADAEELSYVGTVDLLW